jgi:glycosyltransferase involved in cell wall biosynthesis
VTGPGAPLRLDVVIPTLNEAHVLESSVQKLRGFLGDSMGRYAWKVVVADNGSSDGTGEIAQRLAREHPDVGAVLLSERGRGRALRKAWTESDADIVSYMDVDLSTELAALPKVVDAIAHDGFEVATGSRLMRGARIKRSAKRELISRSYNLMIRLLLRTRFSDAQCGFKAVSRRVVREIVPLIEDQGWFFDTELLVLAERLGYPVKDVPVLWIEDNDSRVKIVKTATDDIKGLLRLRRTLPDVSRRHAGLVGRQAAISRN